jgi:hypothetical protein
MRHFCVTEKGYLDLVSPTSQPGDLISIFRGVNTPLVLGLNEDQHGNVAYSLVEDCYVHDMMNGEMMGR